MTDRVIRRWDAVVKQTDLDDWVATYRDRVLGKMGGIGGFQGVAFHAERDADPCNVTVLTMWDDMDAIKRFAGQDPAQAVVPDFMQRFFVHADTRATFHDEILVETNA